MSRNETATPTTRRVSSAPRSETCIVPTLLPICCVCGLIRDESGYRPSPARWMAQRMYRKTQDMNPTTLPLTHTYCPTCFTKVQGTVRQYFREIGSAS